MLAGTTRRHGRNRLKPACHGRFEGSGRFNSRRRAAGKPPIEVASNAGSALRGEADAGMAILVTHSLGRRRIRSGETGGLAL